MDITLNGTLCNSDGQLGRTEFEQIMRREMHMYLQVHTSARVGHSTPSATTCTQHFSYI